MDKFKCNYCGKEYDTAVERARCEIACERKYREEEKRKNAAQIEKERVQFEKELQNDLNNLMEKIESYQTKYNRTIRFNSVYPNLLNAFDLMGW